MGLCRFSSLVIWLFLTRWTYGTA